MIVWFGAYWVSFLPPFTLLSTCSPYCKYICQQMRHRIQQSTIYDPPSFFPQHRFPFLPPFPTPSPPQQESLFPEGVGPDLSPVDIFPGIPFLLFSLITPLFSFSFDYNRTEISAVPVDLAV